MDIDNYMQRQQAVVERAEAGDPTARADYEQGLVDIGYTSDEAAAITGKTWAFRDTEPGLLPGLVPLGREDFWRNRFAGFRRRWITS